jgi:amidohydrolase
MNECNGMYVGIVTSEFRMSTPHPRKNQPTRSPEVPARELLHGNGTRRSSPHRTCLRAGGLTTLLATLLATTNASAISLQDWLGEHTPELLELYQDLHRNPELSFLEEQTAAKMADAIREIGLEVTTGVGGHGVVGVLRNGKGPTLLLRADMDALPVAEETGLEYASQVRVRDDRGATVGVMHACGHDIHMTSLIGSLQYLAGHRSAWRGTLVAIFQPAEERGAGAAAMLADGLFERFARPDYALALHVSAEKPAGTIACQTGYAMANVDSVDIKIVGRGGHGAHPHMTIDPIVIASRLVLDLQTIVSREIKPIEPAVVTVGAIHGGSKHNVIADRCDLQLTVRSYAPEVRRHLLDAIQRKAEAAAQSAAAPPPEVSISEGTPALYNDPTLAARVLPAIEQAIGKERILVAEPTMGGEDFGRLGRAGVPILMLGLGSVDAQRLASFAQRGETPPSLHSSQYYPDAEETIRGGVTALCIAALELLQP